jgi:hypothetical protein
VFVYDDSSPYYEKVVVDKSINLVGEDRDTTVIDGSKSETVVWIWAEWVNISGFTIQNSGDIWECAGIFVDASYSSVNDNFITDNIVGVMIGSYATGNYNSIHNNTIKNNIYGIYVPHAWNWFNKIFLNNIYGNNVGISIESCNYNEVFSNNIMSNIDRGIGITSCMCGGHDNRVYHNNFIYNGEENYEQAFNHGNNYFDDGYPSGGNYWSDYTGMDNYSGSNQTIPGSDGIGDLPYLFPYYTEDSYPLIKMWDMDIPPIAEFTWTPLIPEPGELIIFNSSESYDYDGFITIYEWDWDNDGIFDVSTTNHYTCHIFETAGYYLVTLRVHNNISENDTDRTIVRIGNEQPYAPYDPIPKDGVTNVSNDIWLYWNGGDPDGDPVTYDVYFGTSSDPQQVISNQSDTTYKPNKLLGNTVYYWRIVAWDELGASTAGSLWRFTTIPVDLEISIDEPKEKTLYYQNKPLLSLPRNTIIIGYIHIYMNTISEEEIEKVELYINDELKGEYLNEPYFYGWYTAIPFRYKIKAVAYDTIGNIATSELTVWKIF